MGPYDKDHHEVRRTNLYEYDIKATRGGRDGIKPVIPAELRTQLPREDIPHSITSTAFLQKAGGSSPKLSVDSPDVVSLRSGTRRQDQKPDACFPNTNWALLLWVGAEGTDVQLWTVKVIKCIRGLIR
jgi:hypothetical protein